MIKKHLRTLILTTLIILLPILAGLLLWNQLPDQIPTHWNIDGEVDGWSSKPFAVFCLPLFLAALHWVCVLASATDPKSGNVHSKMFNLVLWSCPVISLVMESLVYATALGHDLNIEIIMPLLVGVMFIVVGNLLPKCRQSYTMGIKLPWTLNDEENWNKTHRFGGKIWVIGGVITMSTAFIGSFWLLLGVLIVMVVAPTVYSYLYYRKHRSK